MHGGRVGTTRRGAARSVVVASVLTATLTGTLTATAGCTVASHQEPGQATAAVADALAEARSAAQATRITVEQLSRGRLTGPVADTALLDQLRALDDAELALTTLVPPDATSSDQRSTGLSAVGDVTDVVVRAREWTAARSGETWPARTPYRPPPTRCSPTSPPPPVPSTTPWPRRVAREEGHGRRPRHPHGHRRLRGHR
nr:hypothetical protein GCM10025730_19690 [Promicromonospora thailandica]